MSVSEQVIRIQQDAYRLSQKVLVAHAPDGFSMTVPSEKAAQQKLRQHLEDAGYDVQSELEVDYKEDYDLKLKGRSDLVVQGLVILELKHADTFTMRQNPQVLTYMKALHCQHGMLILFPTTEDLSHVNAKTYFLETCTAGPKINPHASWQVKIFVEY